MWKKAVLVILSTVVFLVVVGGILFLSAGRWDLPLFWAYLGVFAAAAVVGALVVDPGLIQERLRPGPGGDVVEMRLTTGVLIPLWLAQHVVAGLDVGRFQWSVDTLPLAVQVIGLLALAAGLAVMTRVAAVNRFASTVIRIQTERGHQVITTGPYRFVRHPMYTASFFLFIGGGLALGSWPAAMLGVLMVLPILRRTAVEDRTLREKLDGYEDYARKVRYRLIPGVW